MADNNSKDRTIEIVKNTLKESIKLEIYKSKKTTVSFINFFRCLDEVQTDYFCWLAHDDYLGDNWLEENIKVHLKNRNCISSFGEMIFLNENGERTFTTGVNKKMQIPRAYPKGSLLKFLAERQIGPVFYEFGVHNTFLFKKTFPSQEMINKLSSVKVGGDTCLTIALLSKGSLCNTKETRYFRRNRKNSEGAGLSKSNILFRIFLLELPWSFFLDVSEWISFTFKKNRIFYLLILVISSRFQSFQKIVQRLFIEIKNIKKNNTKYF